MVLVIISSALLIVFVPLAFFIVARDAQLLDGLGLVDVPGVSLYRFVIDRICADWVHGYSCGLSGMDTTSIPRHGNYQSRGNSPGAT